MSEFVFKKHDSIGHPSAEHDDDFFSECFVNTGDYDELLSPTGSMLIVIGRTGTGKSALFRRLKEDKGRRVMQVEPEQLSLGDAASSEAMQFATSLGINLDPIFKLLWRHVFTVEALRMHYRCEKNKEPDKGVRSWLLSLFSNTPDDQKQAEDAIARLEHWGSQFWETTDIRVKEITQKLEAQLEAEVGASGKIPKFLDATARAKFIASMSSELKADVKQRVQRVVSQDHVRDVKKATELLQQLFVNEMKCCYIVVDKLDENWIEDAVKLRLLKSLMETVSEFIRVPGLKVIIALRRDLLDRVIRSTPDLGFQEEKLAGLYLPLTWTQDDLLSLLNLRVKSLIRRRYTKEDVMFEDVLPSKFDRQNIADAIYRYAERPRDVIALFNSCIVRSLGQPKITRDSFGEALGDYSRGRLRALADEWRSEIADMKPIVKLLRGRKPSIRVSELEETDLDDFVTQILHSERWDGTTLRRIAAKVDSVDLATVDFRSELVYLLYRIGLVGLKVAPDGPTSWRSEAGQSVSHGEISSETRMQVHPSFQKALGIVADKPE